MSTTCEDIQALIDAEVQLIASYITNIADLQLNPRPNYSIDNQNVSWGEFLIHLSNAKKISTQNLNDLYDLKNRICPYQYINQAY